MAIIEARVVNVSADGITVSASREGGCKSCSQNQHCAILWQHELTEKLVSVSPPTYLASKNSLSSPTKPLALGDAINLHCDERTLLLYISLLFLPTLILLLLSALSAEWLFSELSSTMQTLMSCSMAFFFGTGLSRYLLAKFNNKLLPKPQAKSLSVSQSPK